MNLMWFRNDLRVDDNAALSNASQEEGGLIAIYLINEGQWNDYGIGANRQAMTLSALNDLEKNLKRENIPLIILVQTKHQSSEDCLESVINEYNVTQLFFNIEYPLDERRRDDRVIAMCSKKHVGVQSYNDDTLIPPWSVLTQSSTPYKVFTPFKNRVLAMLGTGGISHFSVKKQSAENLGKLNQTNEMKPTMTSSIEPPTFKEAAVHNLLIEFTENDLEYYRLKRDCLDQSIGSQLSTALSLGTLSIRRCYDAARFSSQDSDLTWLSQLIWRDFYRYIVWHFDHVSQGQAFLDVDKRIRWENDPQKIELWKSGKTGIPVVDAAISELLNTGLMHNRARMITASFLVKNLFVDWRIGEAFFAQHLFDYDFANNNGGWQWCASVGTDASPYFRVFNPASQAKKFDPESRYVKHWVPSLKEKTANEILNFEKKTISHYYPQIVDLKESRRHAIETFQRAKNK